MIEPRIVWTALFQRMDVEHVGSRCCYRARGAWVNAVVESVRDGGRTVITRAGDGHSRAFTWVTGVNKVYGHGVYRRASRVDAWLFPALEEGECENALGGAMRTDGVWIRVGDLVFVEGKDRIVLGLQPQGRHFLATLQSDAPVKDIVPVDACRMTPQGH